MLARAILVLLVVGLIGAAAMLSMSGYGGQSTSVQSARVGSPGGGYGFVGGVK